MMRHIRLGALVVAVLAGGCFPPQQPAQEPSGSAIPEESKAMVRQGDEMVLAAQKQMDEEIDKNQAEIEKAMKAAVGQEASFAGGPMPMPASQAIKEVRAAKIELSISPVLDAQGKPVANQFMQLEDSYSKRAQEIGPKMASKKATQAEIKFLQDGVQHVQKINDLKAQVRLATTPAMNAGWMVTTGSMTTMTTVAGMIRSRRQMEMQWTDQDYEMVRQLMERQSRREAVAALSMALMATYQAVVNHGADPSLIDDVAKAGIEAIPLQGQASLEDAKTYVDHFAQNVEASQKTYEEQMRKTFGDQEYEAKYKAQLDGMFAQAASATKALSATELMAQTNEKYKADLEKCARGEALPPDTMVGPAKCKEAKASANPDGSLSPDVLQRLTGGSANAAQESSSGGLMGLLGSIPGVAQVKLALEGVA
ncbi:MAG TPA: hypothetical protein PLV85_15530, partial [Polyangiaceae bacterium]|nr:hypothetical protein [Polyangiaceae bacterium]